MEPVRDRESGVGTGGAYESGVAAFDTGTHAAGGSPSLLDHGRSCGPGTVEPRAVAGLGDA